MYWFSYVQDDASDKCVKEKFKVVEISETCVGSFDYLKWTWASFLIE